MYTTRWWGKPEGKKRYRRPGHRWEHNIKIGLTEIVYRINPA
jgi:hypothetical protein